MSLPIFIASPDPVDTSGPWPRTDMKNLPRCAACDDVGPVCDSNMIGAGLCRACWRVVVLLPAAALMAAR